MMNLRFQQLLDKYLSGKLSEAEWLELSALLSSEGGFESLETAIEQQLLNREYAIKEDLPATENKLLRGVLEKVDRQKQENVVSIFSKGWFRYAASIVFVIGVAAIAFFWNSRKGDPETAGTEQVVPADIFPGGEKAVLTLADGRIIELDSATNGKLAEQGGVRVVKLANGQIAYDLRGLAPSEVLWNTMSTPTGGQYGLVLPDGSRVWLNAASSITFPTAFQTNERRVKISGEVYFEVAKNKHQPFIVDANGQSVEVLGTSFNINSYKEEGVIKTALVSGSVKVIKGNKEYTLDPGYETIVGGTENIQVQKANLEQVLAWKNGLFNFNGLELPVVMRQLERWYDVKVKYPDNIPRILFRGKMYRTAQLSEALEIFKMLGVKFRLEGKTLIIIQ